MIFGARISLSIGLISVFLSLFIGLILGGLAGYYGGAIDNLIQRLIEILRSMPTIPLWMGLSAAVPSNWPPLRTYFAITIVLSVVGWTTLARRVRGAFLSLREEDFVISARLAGASERRIIFTHMLPSFMSYVIVSVTMSIPQMILGETSLSFLGLGLRPPVISWGVLLREAQNLNTIAVHPWLLVPAIFVVASVLAFNFIGDGLRDAADPYSPSVIIVERTDLMSQELLLKIRDLKVQFSTREGTVNAERSRSGHLQRRDFLGVVGESGCGKSMTARSILGLIPKAGKIVEETSSYIWKTLQYRLLVREPKKMSEKSGAKPLP